MTPDRQTIYENFTGYRFTTGDEHVDCSCPDSDNEMGVELIQEACNQMEYTRLYDTDSDDEDPPRPDLHSDMGTANQPEE